MSRLAVLLFLMTTMAIPSSVLSFSPRPQKTPMMESRTRSLFTVASRENEIVAEETEPFDSTVKESIDAAQLDVLQERKELSLAMPENLSIEMGRLLVIIAAALCGTNFSAVKLLDQAMPLAASAALRFTLAAIVVTVMVVGQEKTQQEKTTQQEENKRGVATLMGVEVGAWYCIGYLCQAYGLHTVDASKSAFFNALAVIFVPLLDSFFRGKTLGPKGIGSVFMAVAGVALLQIGPSLGENLSITPGDIYSLAQALFFGIGYWRLESTSCAYPDQAARITVGQLMAVAGGAIFYCLLVGEIPSLELLQHWWTNEFIVKTLLWTGLFSTALAMYLETVALKVVSASELTVIMTSISLWGSAFAYFTLGEVLAPVGMLGGLLILSGCVLTSTQEP